MPRATLAPLFQEVPSPWVLAVRLKVESWRRPDEELILNQGSLREASALSMSHRQRMVDSHIDVSLVTALRVVLRAAPLMLTFSDASAVGLRYGTFAPICYCRKMLSHFL